LPAFNMVQRDRFMRQEQEMERMYRRRLPRRCERIPIVVTACGQNESGHVQPTSSATELRLILVCVEK
jgi:hypothetical protein